jgi:hypothetical protein
MHPHHLQLNVMNLIEIWSTAACSLKWFCILTVEFVITLFLSHRVFSFNAAPYLEQRATIHVWLFVRRQLELFIDLSKPPHPLALNRTSNLFSSTPTICRDKINFLMKIWESICCIALRCVWENLLQNVGTFCFHG